MKAGKGHDNHKIRTTTISFRVTDEEKATLGARIKVCGLPKGEYFRQSLLYQTINITAGRYHSDRLALEIRRMREVLESLPDNEEVGLTIRACNELLEQMRSIQDDGR